ncbi:hypothetical protein [Sphingomonas glacialis]|uniref:Uncharacterized protein n=1 Tax=Sphingomonas glacialis TaxID=658225 RepID=A0A502FWK4_9SPHN|nr:hypothetical protein [Sphingomonas glacialis]TPG53888.1 hypothetical protein EAH76_04030 [Sphingomonas glacialis]
MQQPIDLFVDALWERYREGAYPIALQQAQDAHHDDRIAASWHEIAARLAARLESALLAP